MADLSEELRAKPQFGDPVGPWYWWFAWRPVRTWDYRWVWLVWTHRRRIQKHDYLDGPAFDWWQYRYDGGYVAQARQG